MDNETDIRKRLHKRNMEVVLDFRNPLLQVFLKEVLKLTSELHTCWTTTDNHHMEKSFDFLRRLVLESGGFDAVHDSSSDLLRISNFF